MKRNLLIFSSAIIFLLVMLLNVKLNSFENSTELIIETNQADAFVGKCVHYCWPDPNAGCPICYGCQTFPNERAMGGEYDSCWGRE